MKKILFCLLALVLVLSASCDQEIKPTEYTVSFDANGGVGTLPDTIFATGGGTALPSGEGLSKEGYVFAGWSEEPNGDLVGESLVVSKDTILYARWQVVEYSITYDLGGGSFPEGSSVPSSYTIDDEVVVSAIPEKDGCSFLGWKTESEADHSTEAVIKKGSTGDVVFIAVWKTNEYTILFELGGGTGDVPPIVAKNGESVTLPSGEGLSRAGYGFIGWSEEPNGKSVGESLEVSKDTILYARWQAVMYKITYELDGGAFPTYVANPNYYTTDTGASMLLSPQKNGYAFLGWTEGDSTELLENVALEKGSIGDRTFKANWKVVEYRISYDLDGGSISEASRIDSYTVEDPDFGFPVPTKDGYSFMGWKDSYSSKPQRDYIVKRGSTGDLEVKAVWRELSKYGISYDGNGSTDFLNPEEKTEGKDFVLPSSGFERLGYKLVGWNIEADGSGDFYELGGIYTKDEGCTFYAVWELITYKITYMYFGTIPEGETEPAWNIESTYTVEDLPIKLEPANQNHSRFVSWILSTANGSTRVTQIPEGTMGDIILTPEWEKLPRYSITYDYDNGSDEVLKSTRYSDEAALVIEECSKEKEGYVFSHWYSDDDTVYMPGSTYFKDADLNLHAYWVQECLSFGDSINEAKDACSVSFRKDFTGEVESIEIPSIYKGKRVDSIAEGGFLGCSMKSVVIPDSVNHICKNAFDGCSQLSSLDLPSEVLMCDSAFAGCSALVSLELPLGFEMYGSVFSGCSNLATLTISEGKRLGDRAFECCSSLTKVFVNGEATLGSETFYNCPIEEIHFGDAELRKKWTEEAMKNANIPSNVTIKVGGTVVSPVSAE